MNFSIEMRPMSKIFIPNSMSSSGKSRVVMPSFGSSATIASAGSMNVSCFFSANPMIS